MQRVDLQPDKPYAVALHRGSKWLQYQIHSQTYFHSTRCYLTWAFDTAVIIFPLRVNRQGFLSETSFHPIYLTLSYTVIAYLWGSLVALVFGPFKSACWTRPVKLAICCSIAFIRSLQKHQKILLSALRPVASREWTFLIFCGWFWNWFQFVSWLNTEYSIFLITGVQKHFLRKSPNGITKMGDSWQE